MNWRRGVFRAWAVGSAIWIVAIGIAGFWSWYNDPYRPERERCAENNPMTNFGCNDPIVPSELNPPVPWPTWAYVLLALGVPLGALGLGYGVRWTLAGLRDNP